MKALSPAGLCDQIPPGACSWQDGTGSVQPWSPSPVTTISYKSHCSERRFSLESGRFPLGYTVNARTLEHRPRRPTRNWTYLSRSSVGPLTKPPQGRQRPLTAARQRSDPLGASSPERPAGANCGPHGSGQPSEGLAPRNGRTAARGDPPEAPPSCAVRIDSRRRPEARAAAPRGAPSHPADDERRRSA